MKKEKENLIITLYSPQTQRNGLQTLHIIISTVTKILKKSNKEEEEMKGRET